MATTSLRIGLLGAGIVGGGLVETLRRHGDLIARRTGVAVSLYHVAEPDSDKLAEFDLGGVKVSSDAAAVIDDPDVDVVVELIGGEEPALSFTLDAMRRGKHVVTANKKLIALHGDTISRAAAENGVGFRFEASVAGGIPVIKALREGLVANDIKLIYGIVNGTGNYILTRMAEENDSFDSALAEAHRLGFAEADPTLDIDGWDSAHKIQIMASLAFATWVRFDDICVEGIRGLSAIDVQYAAEMGYVIKLLAIVKQTDDGAIDIRVQPTFVSTDHLLAAVRHEFNAVYIEGDIVGTTLYYGKGAGRFPTASAVVADLVDLARGTAAGTAGHEPPFVLDGSARVVPIEEIECAYYMRFTTADRPGVLGQIATILGEHDVSVDSAIQKPIPEGRTTAPIVLMTHRTRERNVRRAIESIDRIECVQEATVVFRVE